jgi:hypothetical protein
MRRALLPLLSFAVVVFFAPAARADDAKEIINKAIKAHGGKKVLSKYKGGKASMKGKITLPMIGETDFTREMVYMLPDKFKETLELEVGGNKFTVVTIANGKKISIDTNGTEVKATDAIKNAIKDAQYMLKVGRLVSLVEDKGYKLEGLGEIKVEDKPAVGVRVTAKDEKDVNLYFYKDSGLLAKVEARTVEPTTDTEITEERIFVEYQKEKKNGQVVPKTILVKRDGKDFLKADMTEMNHLETVDDSEFEK